MYIFFLKDIPTAFSPLGGGGALVPAQEKKKIKIKLTVIHKVGQALSNHL